MAGTVKGAALPLETADASGVGADDKVAILVAHQVAQETAALSGQIDELKATNAEQATEIASLKDKLDVAETAKAAAEKALTDHKAEQANAAEQAKVAEVRKAEVAKIAPALLEGDEDRVAERLARWTSMDEAAFTAYVAELASVAGKSNESFEKSGETALNRKQSTATKSPGRTVLGLPS